MQTLEKKSIFELEYFLILLYILGLKLSHKNIRALLTKHCRHPDYYIITAGRAHGLSLSSSEYSPNGPGQGEPK
jgi:hypothetical protein